MEAAYGLSITVTMLMTTVLLVFYLFKKRINKWLVLLFALVYLSLELGFFSANVIKFFEGGWITVFLAGFIGICMYAWYNGRMIKTKFIKFVKLEHYISTIQDMKLDETILNMLQIWLISAVLKHTGNRIQDYLLYDSLPA